MTILSFKPYQNISLNGTLYQPKAATQLPIVYLHGGGLIFGERDDLPQAYIDLFLAAGHPFITLDYLLSPEVHLDIILAALQKTLTQLQLHSDYILMGRSAGAYLGALLIKHGEHPHFFLDFYGYFRLDLPEFNQPAPFYQQFPRVLPLEAASKVQKQAQTTGSMNQRYPIYLSARQFGNWLNYFLEDKKNLQEYSLSSEELTKFPKTILIHCQDDPDVPYHASTVAAKHLPDSQLITLKKAQHDFDRLVTPYSLAVYRKVIKIVCETDRT